MLSRSLCLFKPFGIEIRVHWSWAILAFLIASSLATAWFPSLVPGLTASVYWMAAIVCALGLFLSIVIHEFCHAIVGRMHKMPVEKITLFLFGGVAHLEDEPPSPKAEFQMAIAGPLASVALALAFYGWFRWSVDSSSPVILQASLSYLASINIVVAVFNMLPGFPLDGGRVLRAALWQLKKDIVWATKISSNIGVLFGVMFIALGLVAMFSGEGLSGLWPMLLGFLIISFARASYVQTVLKQALHGQPTRQFMDPLPVTLSPETPVADFIRGSQIHTEQTLFPVVGANQEFLGCASPSAAMKIPEREWSEHNVREIVESCEAERQIDPEADADSAFQKMSASGARELLVVKGGRLLGILNRSSLIRYLQGLRKLPT